MPASPASVSVDVPPPRTALAVGVNWLGDSVMLMPALQAWRRAYPAARLVLLVKPALAPLWRLHAAADAVWTCRPGAAALARAVRAARAERPDTAYILPHSFRSTLVPFLARIPRRIGPPGHGRDWMLTEVRRPPADPLRRHQAFEHLAVLGLSDTRLEPACLRFDPALEARARTLLGTAGLRPVALLPGAARGPAKQWPPAFFAAAGRLLHARWKCPIVVFGSAAERALAESVARGAGPGARNLAGQTTLPELAAALSQCALAVSNDSGGMHLAAAAGIPVVAIFGLTDPTLTGPLGPAVRILQSGAPRGRDVPRASAEARARLAAIPPERVAAAAGELLEARPDAR